MSETWSLGIKLLVITAIAGFALGFTNYLTEEPIANQRLQADIATRAAVLKSAKDFVKLDIDDSFGDAHDIIEIYSGTNTSGESIGYTFKILAKGFGGDMEVVVGIDVDGDIDSVRVGSHSETPGLGDKASDEEFLSQFTGKSARELIRVKKAGELAENEVEALTGATITTDAVSEAVNLAIEYYNKVLEQGREERR